MLGRYDYDNNTRVLLYEGKLIQKKSTLAFNRERPCL